MLALRKSKRASRIAGAFLVLAALAFAGHLYSAFTDPFDSGESAVLFVPFTLPWSLFLPDALVYSKAWRHLGSPVMWIFVGLNAFLLYCISGGLRRSGRGQ